MTTHADVAIVGGGLAGCVTALVLAEQRPELAVLLLEASDRFGGNHVWSFFDGDLSSRQAAIVAPAVLARWPEHELLFPRRRRRLALGYRSVCSGLLDRTVRERLPSHVRRTDAAVADITPDAVTCADGERVVASCVIDARGPTQLPGLETGWQKFVGLEFRFDVPHGLDCPVIMDATVDQAAGYRFVYCLPFDRHRMLVEDTYYSLDPRLDVPVLRARIERYVGERGWSPAEVLREERGVLPVALAGDVDATWRATPVPAIGLRGGFFHPTTGYSLPDALRIAERIAREPRLTSAGLHGVLAAVIGSGFGGLALAIRLQAAGIATTIVEARDRPGGRAYVWEQDGHVFDAGPTVITDPACLRELWDLTGARWRTMSRCCRSAVLPPVWNDGTACSIIPTTMRNRTQIAKLDPADVAGYAGSSNTPSGVYEEGYLKLGAVPFLDFTSMLRAAPALAKHQAWRSVYSVVSSFVKNDKLRQALSFHTLLVGGNPMNTSASTP
jgi:lycopene beta-cyclase